MMDREPFAKVVSFGEGVGEDFRIEIEGIPVYCPNNDSGETADKINASVEARVKKAVEEFRERAAKSIENEWANGANGLTRFVELAEKFGNRAAAKIRALPIIDKGNLEPNDIAHHIESIWFKSLIDATEPEGK